MKDLAGYRVHAVDGGIGKVRDFYFDDASWTIRYVVVETGGFLDRHGVLISPARVSSLDWSDRVLHVSLTREQIRNSPDIRTDRPVSRQHEVDMATYYGWPSYWSLEPMITPPLELLERPPEAAKESEKGDPHLRSFAEVNSYGLDAVDGPVGFMHDWIADGATWRIVAFAVDTGSWLPGKKVLLDIGSIASISWEGKRIHVNQTIEAVRQAPSFHPDAAVSLGGETYPYDYHGKPVKIASGVEHK